MTQTEHLSAADYLKVKRVLIYRLGSLGDTVVALPALHLIAKAFPNAERRMLTNAPVHLKAPTAAAVLEGTGLVHGYFSYKVGVRNPFQVVWLWWQLIRWRPQAVIYLAAFRGHEAVRRDSQFFSLCGIKRKIGVPVTQAMQQNLWMEVERALEPEAHRLVRTLAELGTVELGSDSSWDLRISASEILRASEALVATAGLPVLAVSVGTKVQSKDWGAENWRALLRQIAVEFQGFSLAMCGAGEESAASEAAAEGWRGVGGGPVVNLCGRLTPRESAAVFAEAQIFIGHDSGPMHLAAAVQTPCVAIFAARNKPRVWFPYGSQHRVLYHKVDCWGCGLETCLVEKKKCITSITVAEVMTEVKALLG